MAIILTLFLAGTVLGQDEEEEEWVRIEPSYDGDLDDYPGKNCVIEDMLQF